MTPLRVFLTGEPGCGKTTVIRKIHDSLQERGVSVGGMVSGEIRRGGIRAGFSLEDLITHESGTLAQVGLEVGPRVGKYRVNLSDIQAIGVTAIRRAVTQTNVVIIDELGPMELHSAPFVEAVQMALASEKHIIGTIHKRASHNLINSIKSNPETQIVEVSVKNRELLPNQISEQLTRYERLES